jgi:xanthine dehydrogenase YagS FAD-binding subunit
VRTFSYSVAHDVDSAIAAAATEGRYIAGGTTLVDLMRVEVEQPTSLIDIGTLRMGDVEPRDGGLSIGALCRMSDVAAHPVVREAQPLVVEALLESASPQIRNMATIGGNLLQRVRCPYFRAPDAACNKRSPGSGCAAIDGVNAWHAILGTSAHCIATHPSDLAVALVALRATVRTRGRKRERCFPVEDLFLLPGDTPHLEHSLEPGELIVSVELPDGAYARKARYVKVRDRTTYEFALVSVAVALDVDVVGCRIRAARIAAGGVGTKPWRMAASEDLLIDQTPGPPAWERAADRAIENVTPLAGNGYKVQLLRRTIIRALELTAEGR